MVQFMLAVAEMAQGASSPSVHPVWARELLNARTPPRITHPHREYDEVEVIDAKCALPPVDQLVRQYVFFGPSEMLALKQRLPPHLRQSSAFEIITACNWWCRNVALDLHPEQEVQATFTVSVRSKFDPPLPIGYYGNSFVTPTAVSTVGKLHTKPLGYAVELVKEAKNRASAEYLRSVADSTVLRGRPHQPMVHAYLASDVTGAKFEEVDFGWGKPVYDTQILAKRVSFHVKAQNHNGEHGILVSICLPAPEMERFMIELKKITRQPSEEPLMTCPISSSL